MKKTLLIVDDHMLFGQSLRSMINSFENVEVRQVLGNGKELVDYLDTHREQPDLVLLDINMPIMDGLATMKWLKKNRPQQKVMALSMEDEEVTIIAMVKYGVRGYILKDIQPSKFKEAITTVLNGDFYYSDTVSEKISLESNKSREIDELKEKELEFLQLACTELTYKGIAAEMMLSPKTIENYREKLFQKLGVKSRIGLVVYAIKNKIFFL